MNESTSIRISRSFKSGEIESVKIPSANRPRIDLFPFRLCFGSQVRDADATPIGRGDLNSCSMRIRSPTTPTIESS